MRKEPVIVDSTENDSQENSCQILPGEFAGTGPTGSFFEAPAWVDNKKPPGMTSQADAVAPPGWWIDYVTGKFLFFSPTLIWLSIALLDYFIFPYDFQAAKSFQNVDWILSRLCTLRIEMYFI